MKKFLLTILALLLAWPCQAATLYALVKMQGGSPVIDAEKYPYHGYVLHGQKGDLGLYQITGTAKEIEALKAAPGVTPIGTADKLTAQIADADVTKLNAEATKVVLAPLPSKTTVKGAVETWGKAVEKAYKWEVVGIPDPEVKVEVDAPIKVKN